VSSIIPRIHFPFRTFLRGLSQVWRRSIRPYQHGYFLALALGSNVASALDWRKYPLPAVCQSNHPSISGNKDRTQTLEGNRRPDRPHLALDPELSENCCFVVGSGSGSRRQMDGEMENSQTSCQPERHSMHLQLAIDLTKYI